MGRTIKGWEVEEINLLLRAEEKEERARGGQDSEAREGKRK